MAGFIIKYCYKLFIEFFGDGRLVKEIDDNTAIDFLIYLKDTRPNSAQNTLCTHMRGIRAIFKYFMKCGYIPIFTVSLPTVEETIKEVYSPEEIQLLIKKPKISDNCSFSSIRDWASVCYFLGTGNRLSTVASLKIKDIDFENGEIIIRKTKNHRQQIIPLSHELKLVLLEYLQYRKGEPDDFLFCNAYGNQLIKESLKTCIVKYNKSRGVAKTGIHLFRHTFAKNWILNGGDEFTLQAILGHSSSAMVRVYVNMFGKDLGRNFDKFNPLENMREVFSSKQSIKMRA